MPAEDSEHDFLHYLTCDLPLGYPLKVPVAKLLASGQQSITRRDLLHRQSEFLDFAPHFLTAQPWICYITAIKHAAVLIAIPTYDDQLVDVVDKAFLWDLEEKCKNLLEASRATIDEPTAKDCDRLVLLQTEAAQIDDATKKVGGAIQAGFTAVEPLPPPPPEPDDVPEHAVIPWIVAAAVGCVIAGAIIPAPDGGMIWALLGLIITGVVGARALAKQKTRVNVMGAEFKAYLIHENYLILCRKAVTPILTLPFEARKSALVNLPQCLAALQALPPERDSLEARYIRPFFAREETRQLPAPGK
jgi:hypothetical protein